MPLSLWEVGGREEGLASSLPVGAAQAYGPIVSPLPMEDNVPRAGRMGKWAEDGLQMAAGMCHSYYGDWHCTPGQNTSLPVHREALVKLQGTEASFGSCLSSLAIC